MSGRIIALCRDASHRFSKMRALELRLIAGQGVEGDVHCGVTVKHRSRVVKDPTRPNLRQLHLIHGELLEELNRAGFDIQPGDLGENVTTRGIDLLSLKTGTHLQLGLDALIEVTGLRNPCRQLDDFRPGLMAATLGRAPDGQLIRKAGIMAVILTGGTVREGDTIRKRFAPVGALPLMPV